VLLAHKSVEILVGKRKSCWWCCYFLLVRWKRIKVPVFSLVEIREVRTLEERSTLVLGRTAFRSRKVRVEKASKVGTVEAMLV